MIRKLKIKFIVVSALAMLLALILVLGVVNGISYYNSKMEIFSVMTRISENGGRLPDRVEYRSVVGDSILSEESKYSLRFFSAVLDQNGNVLAMDRGNVASVSEKDAVKCIDKARQRRTDEGFVYESNTTYAFQKTSLANDGTELYVILDCSRQLRYTQMFLKFSLYIGLISMLLLLAFPVLMAILTAIRKSLTWGDALAWLMLLWGTVWRLFLAEKGERMYHGNFTWGYMLAVYLVWYAAVRSYLKLYFSEQMTGNKRGFGFVLATLVLVLHLGSGIYYLIYLVALGHGM